MGTTRFAAGFTFALLPFVVACAASATPGWGDDQGAGGAFYFTAATTGGNTSSSVSQVASTSVSSSVASSSVASSSSASTGSGSTNNACVYPADDGQAGNLDVGNTLPSGLSFQGYPANSSTPGSINTTDLFDCDGSKGINLIVVLEGAVYCPSCQDESQTLESDMQQFAGYGVVVIDSVAADYDQSPATLATATAWKSQFGIQSAAVVADPSWAFVNPNEAAIPIVVIIDPRTMKIVESYSGFMVPGEVIGRASENMN